MGQCLALGATEKQSFAAAAGDGGSGSSSSSSFSRRFSTSKRFSSSTSPSSPSSSSSAAASFSPLGLHSSCISSATKQSLSFVKQQRAKLYIVRRCVTMLLLWHKYGKV